MTATTIPEPGPVSYTNLPAGYQLTHRYVVRERLGSGGFGYVYRVFDAVTDADRVVKIVLGDHDSNLERLRQEYRALWDLPAHPHVIRLRDADLLPHDGTPYLVSDFVDGLNVEEMVHSRAFNPSDVLTLAREVASGLAHVHHNGVYHCDVKPSNLLWTTRGAVIIDFNVAVRSDQTPTHGGGMQRYVPPDLDLAAEPQMETLADRDRYALGITLYECLTGGYPWLASAPPRGRRPVDPRDLPGLSDLSGAFVDAILRMIAPRRANRYRSTAELVEALARVAGARASQPALERRPAPREVGDREAIPPNTNPYVTTLRSFYSQSFGGNQGTRGLDPLETSVYVSTRLDRDLQPAILKGDYDLVIVTGNAGDGKTAFLQSLLAEARDRRARAEELVNGFRFELRGRRFLANYDGSQDEAERVNDAVLEEFFMPYTDGALTARAAAETRLIAINEGRLMDFLTARRQTFAELAGVVARGLATGLPEDGIAVVNLNMRSVVADPAGTGDSILERVLARMTHERFWEACESCDLKSRCYALHNARTFQEQAVGPRVLERLRFLYTLAHLRGRLHITLRDLRSALSYMLISDRDCAEIHDLYAAGRAESIADALYFNSWRGAGSSGSDRLLALLAETDVASTPHPRLDRRLDFTGPQDERSLATFERRSRYDQELLSRFFADLDRDSGHPARVTEHRRYLASARRRFFFESRDDGLWRELLPRRSAPRLMELLEAPNGPGSASPQLLLALNRGEELGDEEFLGDVLVHQVRTVDRGTIRSYRLFPGEAFRLRLREPASPFVERGPDGLILEYVDQADAVVAALPIGLDLFELLWLQGEGYRLTPGDRLGLAQALAAFKHAFSAVPYQDVLLTTGGRDFHRVRRLPDGRLRLERADPGGVAAPADGSVS
jgi:serine/threonine protein kinase